MTRLVSRKQTALPRRWGGETQEVIAVAPTGKAPFVYSYVQTRLKGQFNGK